MVTRILKLRRLGIGWIRGRAIVAVIAAMVLVGMGASARANDSEPGKLATGQPSSGEEGLAAVAETPGMPLVPSTASPSPHPPETPSLNEVIALLQAQEEEIASLRAALRDQQQFTALLAAKLTASSPALIVAEPRSGEPRSAEPPAAVGAAQTDVAQKVAQLETDLGNTQRNLEQRLKNFGPFAFSGDFRLRAEPTFGGPADRSQDRFRERIRLRFNADAALNDQIKGGFSLASGDLNNPISTNQTLNQYDTRKPIAIDRAYATYTPSWFKPLTLTGGKFSYPWFNTELVWDKDLNPEGAGETLAFNIPTPVLRKISVVGFQLPFAENKRTAANDKSLYNTMVYGEQLQTYWQLGNRVKLSAYGSFYDWKYPDSIALSLLTANSASPDDALLALSNTGEQNSIATVTVTNSVTGAKTITSAQFASKFAVVDSLAQIDVVTPSERWPVTFIGDFAENTRACENVKNIPVAAVYSAPCDPHARHGYWLESSLGRTLKKGDWQFSYTRIMVQREAVIGAFNYSEIFPTSNVEIHRPEIMYQLFDNVTLELNGLFGRPLVTAGSPAPAQPLWERLQFDMTYKF
jgi:hypothetical protein